MVVTLPRPSPLKTFFDSVFSPVEPAASRKTSRNKRPPPSPSSPSKGSFCLEPEPTSEQTAPVRFYDFLRLKKAKVLHHGLSSPTLQPSVPTISSTSPLRILSSPDPSLRRRHHGGLALDLTQGALKAAEATVGAAGIPGLEAIPKVLLKVLEMYEVRYCFMNFVHTPDEHFCTILDTRGHAITTSGSIGS